MYEKTSSNLHQIPRNEGYNKKQTADFLHVVAADDTLHVNACVVW